MSVIYGNPIITNGGGVKLNIDYGATPPSDTTKLWVPLATKPSNVECSPVLNYGSEVYSGVVGTFGKPTSYIPSCCYLSGKIYVIAQPNSSSESFANIIDVNTMNAEYQTASQFTSGIITGNQSNWAQLVAYNNFIYIAVGSLLLKKNVLEGTTTQFATLPNLASARCMGIVDGKLYVIGGVLQGNTNVFNTITEIDLVSGSVTNWSTVLPRSIYSAGSISFGKYIYILGGGYSIVNDLESDAIYKLDTVEKNITTLSTKLPFSNYGFAYSSVGSKLYMFGGATAWGYWNQNNYNKNNIVSFDAATETVTQLSQTLDIKLKNACACSDDNGNIYIRGGYGTSSNAMQMRKFVAASPLTNNHLLLQEDFGTDGLWTALKSKDTDFKVKVINAYLGDSNNIAQLTNAYLYDSKDLKWKSLSGESYVADMQNALNILGVN